MSVGQFSTRIMATASPGESIRAAAHRMGEYDVGTLVVLKETRGSRAIGILTDRDITLRCVAEGLDPEETVVADIMTTPVQTVRDSAPMEAAIARMAEAGTRRLVVVEDDDRVAGILSLDDVLEQVSEEVSAIHGLLQRQQPRVPA